MWLPILCLILGLILGQAYTFHVPPEYAKYLGVALLASMDSVLGGIRGVLQDKYDGLVFLTGFFSNAILASSLTFIGDRIELPLYYTAIFVFGVRLFQNLAIVRRILLDMLFAKTKKSTLSQGVEKQC